jgi:hypothetical protein
MVVAVRAFLSIVMLAGFYVLAVVQFVAGIALAVWVTSVTTGILGVKVGVAVFLGTVWAVGRGTWKALRAGRDGRPASRSPCTTRRCCGRRSPSWPRSPAPGPPTRSTWSPRSTPPSANGPG